MFDVDFDAGENREMTREALEIILMLWSDQNTAEYKGKYWTVRIPDSTEWEWASLKHFIKPFQKPHPPIGVAAASPSSQTLKIAGERGYIPMSLGLGPAYLASHWESVLEGAARGNRTAPSRSVWRLVRDVWVAETDEEAFKAAREGMLFRAWNEYLYPLFNYGPVPLLAGMKHDENMPTEDITLEYLLNHIWLVGSPDTVAQKIRYLHEVTGGFGVLLAMVLDNTDNMDGWNRSMHLLVEEVMPQLSDLT
jgi:alkanesulfonate monooxygenase SsuD/methylene tetrahydromethanopterin reductase-like flavin-dependent oxidoreductase (luciferase family)